MKVYAAINAVQAALAKEGISKNRRNNDQKYNFRGIDDIYNAISGLLADNRLCIIPRCVERGREERRTKTGGVLAFTTVKVEYDFVHAEDQSKHTAVVYGEAMDTSDKSTNKAMSAAYKYAIMQTFAIPTEGDNDADATTHEPAPRRQNAEAGAGHAPTDQERAESAPASTNPLRVELNTLMQAYGAKRAAQAKIVASAFGVKTLADLPDAQLQSAIDRVKRHQTASAARRAAAEPPSALGGAPDTADIPV